jgi:hypothetical protein
MTTDKNSSDRAVAFDEDPLWFPARAVNAVGGLSSKIGGPLPRLDLDHVRRRAEAATGLTDWGQNWDAGAAERLQTALETEADLTTIGRQFARQWVVQNMALRLRLVEQYRTRPEILERPIARPLMVINLPRSGATLLQFLLARVPELNSLYPHQILDPIGAERIAQGDEAPQASRPRRRHQVIKRLVPAYRELHPMEAEEPDECNGLLARQSADLATAAIFRIPSFVDYWVENDLGPAYRDMKAQIQLMQGDREPRPWVLRTPAHLFALDVIFEVFPDVCIVQVHRDPVATISSFCSLAATVRRSNSTRVDPTELGPRWTEHWADGCDRAMAARDRAPATASLIDVSYEDLIAAPHDVVDRILDEIAPDAPRPRRDVVQQRVDAGRQGRRHRYEPEWFGIDPDALRERFAPYIERFDVRTAS